MRYCITLEKTMRVAKWFDAEDDAFAVDRAERVRDAISHDEYECGDIEYDFSLVCVDDGRILTPWGK